MKIFVLVTVLLLSLGCSKQGDGRLSERTEVEAEAQLKVEEDRAARMVEDIIFQSQFYEKIYGDYEGTIQTDSGPLAFRFKIFAHSPIFIPKNRSLTVREAEELLIKQSFNIQAIVVYDVESNSSFGCQFEAIKGDLVNGEINLLSEECGYVFNLAINNLQKNSRGSHKAKYANAVNGLSAEYSKDILSDRTDEVLEIIGEARPALRDVVFYYTIRKVK